MFKKLAVLSLIIRVMLPGCLFSQAKSPFSGDPAKYKEELTLFMGPNLNDVQKANLKFFIASWDSSAFSRENMTRLIDISSQFSARSMRPVPHFNDFFLTLKAFIDKGNQDEILGNWLTGLSETLFNPRFSTDRIARYIKNTGLMIRDNILSESSAIQWKVKGSPLSFLHDTVFYVEVNNATLTCYSQRDSTEIYNVSGYYFPEIQQFHGKKGKITWEKAGYQKEDVFAEIENYNINVTKNNFTIDSARLTHKTYFKEPVYGSLTDQAITFKNKDRANFPRFETYIKEFKLDNIYQGVNYQGGLTFEGATVKGAGTKFVPAKITLFRNDTLYLKIQSDEFIFSKNGLNSAETNISLYLGTDSIYHSDLAFSYNANMRQVNLFRGNNPVSKSPYFDSFHNLDMTFEYLSWDMNESKIILSRARGAALGQALFESRSYFDINYFMRLAGIDNYHPLLLLKRFADYYYSQTFPVEEFAKWLNRPVEAVTALCIDMANKGFVFYNRKYNEITLKDKVFAFLDSYSKKRDYDVLSVISETKAPVDNAVLDLRNFRLTVNGVRGVYLSDSQRVAIYPYKQQLVIGKNRDLEFDGVVEAGLFTVFGHNFSFNYDTFKIRLEKIDSIKIAVETNKKDDYGNPIIKDVDNLIQLGTAELYIDQPDNKSGLKSLKQYPIINAITYSYIFFDKIPGLEGVYPQQDFYFKVDPFTYENIDHYTNEDMNLAGEFIAGNILKPTRQYLTIQENNSLGFNMIVPDEGIDVYESKGVLYENINMSNKGLIGGGSLKHLTSTTKSEEFEFFPDSMVTQATTFDIDKDGTGLFPYVNSKDVAIKWLTKEDEWLATNAPGKNFSMFDNGTILDGSLTLTPAVLKGSGIINTTDSRITSDLFSFTSGEIKADTSVYDLKSPTTSGYAFIAENVKTDINFDTQLTDFHLNTDTSMVKFPEIQYICTMTDFNYNMTTKVLNMEQRGKKGTELLPADKLLALSFNNLDKPTFFATNVNNDTIKFTSWKGSYHLNEEYIEAENINYIHIADALIQPDKGKIIINRRAKIQQLQNAIIAINNKHILHSAKIDIESTRRYFGSAIYDYVDENKDIQQINFAEVTVDTLATSAKGYIPLSQKFKFSPDFTFSGDVNLYAAKELLSFTGSAGIIHNCRQIASYPVKFKSYIDPKNVMIPISEKPRDTNDNMIFSGSFLNIDSIHVYPTFLSAQKSWTDANLVSAQGFLYFDKAKGRYVITSREKLADQSLNGNMVAYDRNFCILSSEGSLNFGTNFDLVKMTSAGKVIHTLDSNAVNINAILAFDFYFSPEALKMMSDEIRMIPTLKPVNLNNEMYIKGMKDLIGVEAARQMKEELDLFGTSRNLPEEFNFELLLNDVNLYWNKSSSTFRSKGPIGIGFIGTQPVNVYVDGYIEIQRRRSGDMFDIYLKANETTWYYFSYIRGNMMTQAYNINYNTLIANTKQSLRKHPDSTVRTPYTYMIAVEDRLSRFLQRMRGENTESNPGNQEAPIR
jgi:hypothetical protein